MSAGGPRAILACGHDREVWPLEKVGNMLICHDCGYAWRLIVTIASGAVGDGVTDDAPAIQAAIDDSMRRVNP